MKLKSLKNIEGSKTNPFMVELKGKMYLQPRANTIIAKGQEIIDTTTGQILQDTVLIGKRKIVDKSQFAKIYASEIGLLFDLSKAAINVFLYLTKVMDYEQKAIFEYGKDYKELGYKSEVSALNGLRELVTKNIIYPHSVSGLWWLNPTIVCKGERFAKYTEYVTDEYLEEAEKRKNDPLGGIKDACANLERRMNHVMLDNKKEAMEAMINNDYRKKGINHALDGELHFDE